MDFETESFTAVSNLGFSFWSFGILALLALLFSSYVKIVTVLSFLRFGFGTSSLPAVVVTSGLALSLSLLVMYPTFSECSQKINSIAGQRVGRITDSDKVRVLEDVIVTWKKFMVKHSGKEELRHFSQLLDKLKNEQVNTKGEQWKSNTSQVDYINTPEALSFAIIAPSFVVSELKAAFKTGLSIILPFFVIEMLMATVLTAIGFSNVNPTYAALPFKLLVFVAVDGWGLITTNLVASYLGG